MPRFLATVIFLVGIFVILSYQNCGKMPSQTLAAPTATDPANPPVQITGTVQKLAVDGCNIVIVSDQNGVFIPMGVDPASLPAGARVSVQGSVPHDFISTCMAGVGLKIDKIISISQ